MCVTAMVALGGAAVLGANSQYQAGKAENQLAKINAGLAEQQAADALIRGEQDVARLRTDARLLAGAQRAGYASQNVAVDSGTALEVQGETAKFAELDAARIRLNAAREAWGYKTQATVYKWQGKMAKKAGKQSAFGTLLGGAANVYGAGYDLGVWGKQKNAAVPTYGGTYGGGQE